MRIAPEHQYILITFENAPVPASFKPLSKQAHLVSIPTRLLTGHKWRRRGWFVWQLYHAYCSAQSQWELSNLIRQERLDVLHLTHGIERQYYAASSFNCHVVATLYDVIPLAMHDVFFDTWSEDEKFVFERQIRTLHHVDIVVAISESARQDSVEYLGLSEKNVRTVPCAVPDEFQSVPEVDVEICLKMHGIHNPYFLFCSGSGRNKNIDRIMAAFRHFEISAAQPHQLVFVGPQEPAQLITQAQMAGISRERFVPTGYVSAADLVCLFSGATALLTPSLYEGFGLPAAQAMLSGTPVIASNRSSHPEVVGDAGLLVDPYNEEEICSAMMRMANNPSLRDELSQRGKDRSQRFNWRCQAEAMLAIYQDGYKQR